MKKLLALLVIIIFATSMIVAVENPFSFSLYNQIKLKAVDESQPGRLQSDPDDVNGDSPANDHVVTKANLNDEMKASASLTIAEIYTMGFYLKGVGEIGFGGDAQRIEFATGMTNAIQAVADYLKIDINAEWVVRWESRQTAGEVSDGSLVSEAEYASYLDELDPASAPHNVDFDEDGTNNEADAWDTVERTVDGDGAEHGQQVDYLLKPSFGLSGSVPDTGISWGFSETIEMQFESDDWKDNDPTYEGYDGDVYDSATGALKATDDSDVAIVEQTGVFQYAKFETKVTFDFEFFHFFAPENITGTLKASNNLKIKLPYSYYVEISKEIVDEFELGFEAGLAGPTVYLALWGETTDYVNGSAPVDGDSGSYRDWDGDWVGFDGGGDWKDNDAAAHERPNMKLGFILNFSYTKEWFSFGTELKAYEDGLRRWDEDGMNDELKWVNEFSIYAKFAL